jgi:hypothetical protein
VPETLACIVPVFTAIVPVAVIGSGFKVIPEPEERLVIPPPPETTCQAMPVAVLTRA